MRPPGRLLALGRVVRPDVTCDTDVTCNTTQKATSTCTYLHLGFSYVILINAYVVNHYRAGLAPGTNTSCLNFFHDG